MEVVNEEEGRMDGDFERINGEVDRMDGEVELELMLNSIEENIPTQGLYFLKLKKKSKFILNKILRG